MSLFLRAVLGVAAASLSYSLVRSSLRPKLLELPIERGGAVPAPPAGGPIPLGPIAADPAPLEPGARYLAAVRVTGLASALATTSRVAAEAEKLGFQNVIVTERAPQAAPPLAAADYYVDATYAGPPRSIARVQGGGRVSVVDLRQIG